MGGVVGGCHQIDGGSTLRLKPQKGCGQLPDGNLLAEGLHRLLRLTADGIILTVDTAKLAVGEKDGAGSFVTGDTRLLPQMERGPGSRELSRSTAEAMAFIAVDAAAPGAEAAVF